MMDASISTVPSVVRTEPRPALNCGWFSNSRTTSSTTSSGERPFLKAAIPTSRQWRRPASRGSLFSRGRSTGMSPAPPCSAIAHPIAFPSQSLRSLSLSLQEKRWGAGT
uniref:Uncharacterized protein n=1 Tax=Opuntia streptacantha TaxID=393608 RepID=A0A7C9D2C4_OPUST